MAAPTPEGGPSDPYSRYARVSPRSARFSLLLSLAIGIAAFAALLALLLPLGSQRQRLYKEGEIAPEQVLSPFRFQIENPIQTEQLRKEAAERVPLVFDEVTSAARVADASLERAFVLAAAIHTSTAAVEARCDELRQRLQAEIGLWLPPKAIATLEANASHRYLQDDIRAFVAQAYNEGIVHPPTMVDVIQGRQRAGLGGVNVLSADGTMRAYYATYNLRSVTDAVAFVFQKMEHTRHYLQTSDIARLETARDLAQAVLVPNLIYREDKTAELREQARQAVVPVMVEVRRGERICTQGEPVTRLQEAKLQRLAELRGPNPMGRLVGYAVLALMPLVLVAAFLARYHRDALESPAALVSIALSVLMVLVLAKIVAVIRTSEPALADLPYAIPVAACGILLTVLRSGRLAVFLVNLTALLCGIVLGPQESLRYVFTLAWSSILGIYLIRSMRKRTDPYKAGLAISLSMMLLILAMAVYDYPTWEEFTQSFRSRVWFALVAGAVNGGLSVGLAVLLLPVFESILGVTTDLRLVELATGSRLLKDLAEKAPGTYHHSLMVATLAEAAADAIGANALLCRVGALYHDIGKMESPQYFIENYAGSSQDRSPHNRMTCHMSVRVIRKHVREGLELARQHGLPAAIQAFIPEHHGTTVMPYFYAKALESCPPGSVREEDFRYLGPKPQSVETAIVMIADTIEAASRTLDPRSSEGTIVQFVRKVINDRFIDGQFDECDLTLRQLHELSRSFVRTLSTIMHRRIIYPAAQAPPVEGKPSLIRERRAERSSDSPPRKPATERLADKPSDREPDQIETQSSAMEPPSASAPESATTDPHGQD